MINKSLFLSIFLLIGLTAASQDFQKEINEQVWKPFIKNFNDHNTAAFMALHAKEVVRSPRDSKSILNWKEYNLEQTKGDEQDVKENRKRTLELRFTERISSKDRAIDVGVYKTSYVFQNSSKQDFYGRFHVVLKKENGIWKILVDTDSSENGTIGEKEFSAASPM
jgi:ketosteroid isomerase-like protein